MSESWNSPLPWAPHHRALAEWAALQARWNPDQGDWPSAVALVAAAEDEGHTALDWSQAPTLWARVFADQDPVPPFDLPPPETWPPELFAGWLVRSGPYGIQTARNAYLETRLLATLTSRVSPDAEPGEGQEEAVNRAARTRFLVIAGGPGTGKTTTLQGLVETWAERSPGLRAVVATPTGRAAARAKASFTGKNAPECLTIHRLLGLRPGLSPPWHGPRRPLPFDLVIVDEASMLDLRTAVALTDALDPGASLVLVGDPGQLPSVDPGSVLAGVLGHTFLKKAVVFLRRRYRLETTSRALARVFDLCQDPGPSIEATIDEIRRLGSGAEPDFLWLETEGDPGPLALKAWGTPGTSLNGLGDRILLSPVHRGPGGTEALGALVDRAGGRPTTPAEGLPWMIERNLPHLELSNGDRGLLVRREGKLGFVLPEEPQRWIPFSLVAGEGVGAWAVTVHKSQGSEFNRVVLVLPSEAMLTRELVYTALTRAKTSAVLVASAATLAAALTRSARRWSGQAFKS